MKKQRCTSCTSGQPGGGYHKQCETNHGQLCVLSMFGNRLLTPILKNPIKPYLYMVYTLAYIHTRHIGHACMHGDVDAKVDPNGLHHV